MTAVIPIAAFSGVNVPLHCFGSRLCWRLPFINDTLRP